MDLSKKTIIAADDDQEILNALTEVLEEKYNVFTALDGNSAFLMVKSYLPDLILLDVVMPGMDGFEVCRRIKGDVMTNKIPVIFLTGKTQTEDAEMGFKSGCDGYLQKPFYPGKLVVKIGAFIEKAEIRKKMT